MIVKLVEATQSLEGKGFPNWGKFAVMKWEEEEWRHGSRVATGRSLLETIGTNPRCVWILDLQTHEGAEFRPGGSARADLEKHRVWVCPLFEPFLVWLYDHPEHHADPQTLPDVVELPAAPFAMAGHRRPGD